MTTTTSARGRRALLAASAALAMVGGAAVTAAPVAAAPPDDGRIAGAWIVTLVDGALPQAVAAEHRRDYGADVAHVYEHALKGYAARMSEAAVERISRDGRVQSIVADREVSIAKPGNKPGGGGGTVESPPQTIPTGIKRVGADVAPAVLAGNGSGAVDVDVAVIDTGIDLDHPDLNVMTSSGKNCIRNGNTDDGNGHGTHVAGTIGARDDATGVVGVAPGARLHPVRVLDNRGSGSWSSVICGIDWVAANASLIEVANMSLGGGGSDTGCNDGGMHNAICAAVEAGVTFVVAAGNERDDAANHVPAAYDEVITVSALADSDGLYSDQAAWSATCGADQEDTFADFSNYGADVDLIAPGVCILSTWKGGGYSTISGTSMAAPHVAGAAALHRARYASAGPAEVKKALQDAGTTNWVTASDRDFTHEPLLNVAGF